MQLLEQHEEDTKVEITDAQGIVGLRNQIIHDYYSITDENIRAIIINHLPKLKEEVDSYSVLHYSTQIMH